jgi:hypothetical protein
MAECHITKLSPANSCIQIRLISKIVVSEIVGNCKGLSIFILLEIALQDSRGCFSVVELEDQFVGEGQKPKKYTVLEGEETVISKKGVNVVRLTIIELIVEKLVEAQVEALGELLQHKLGKID